MSDGKAWCGRCHQLKGECGCPTAPDPVGGAGLYESVSDAAEEIDGLVRHFAGVSMTLETYRPALVKLVDGQLAALRAENERLRADLHGCQDGALVRDLKARNERLTQALVDTEVDIALKLRYRRALEQARESVLDPFDSMEAVLVIIDAALEGK